jgi:hypothetical protein
MASAMPVAALGSAGCPAAAAGGVLADRAAVAPAEVGAGCRGVDGVEPPPATNVGDVGASASPRLGESEDVRGGKGEEDPPRGTTSPAPELTAASSPESAPACTAVAAAARLAAAGVVRARVHTLPLAGLSEQEWSTTITGDKEETEDTASSAIRKSSADTRGIAAATD